jgi:hypothetical protein
MVVNGCLTTCSAFAGLLFFMMGSADSAHLQTAFVTTSRRSDLASFSFRSNYKYMYRTSTPTKCLVALHLSETSVNNTGIIDSVDEYSSTFAKGCVRDKAKHVRFLDQS